MTALEIEPIDPVLVDLRRLCPRTQRFEEGGFVYYFLPGLVLGEKARPERCDALLRVGGCDGYTSRLYLETRVEGPNALNWNSEAFILQRKWHAFSWQARDCSTGLRLLTAHLRAFR